MIWALLIGGIIAVFFAFSDTPLVRPDVLRDRIEAHVKDEKRAEAATERVDAFETLLQAQVDAQKEAVDGLKEELEKARADRKAIEGLIDRADAQERKAVLEILELREDLKKNVTADEWPKVFSIAAPTKPAK